MQLDQLDTPAAVVDLDRMQANITRLQQYLDEHSIANRPHIKTHKIPAIAQMQIDAGAVGITCQKIGEAEVMAAGGLRDIFIPYNIIGEAKLDRLMTLAKQVKLSVTADSEVVVKGLSQAAQRFGVEMPVLIEFDSGAGRCGVQSPQQAADLAMTIAQAGGLRFGGLMTYPTNDASDVFVRETKARLKGKLDIERVSGGGSPKMWEAHQHPEVNEQRTGMYIYGDRSLLAAGVMSLDDIAFTVITTVVSCPTADRAIIDGGSKTFAMDLMGQDGHGCILEYPDAKIYNLNEEHGFVDVSACAKKPEIGERLTVIPNHCCVVTNLFNEVVGVRGGKVEVTWPVAARGMLQ